MKIEIFEEHLLIFNIGYYSELLMKTIKKICKQHNSTISIKNGIMCITSNEETLYKILLDIQCYIDIILK